ncbi:MAG: nicotinamide-nucleotide amidohydrolase family protein [Pseudomonadota bacterium]
MTGTEFEALAAEAEGVLAALRAAGMTVATAESCTGGLIAAALTAVAGSSDVVERGAVVYSNPAKAAMLGVPPGLIETHGAVSAPVAEAMADGMLAASGASVAVSVTGIAGPGGSETKPEGRVCFGLARAGKATRVETVEFGPLGRGAVRRESARRVFAWLREAAAAG